MDTVGEFRENRLRPLRPHSSRQLQRGEKLRLMLRREPLPATAVEGTSTVRPLLAPAAWAATCGCGVGAGTTASSPSLRNTSRPLLAPQSMQSTSPNRTCSVAKAALTGLFGHGRQQIGQ